MKLSIFKNNTYKMLSYLMTVDSNEFLFPIKVEII